MDAATLRIILLVLGALLLGAMYLWERRRAVERRERESDAPARRSQDERSYRREPSLRRLDLSAQSSEESTADASAFDSGEALLGSPGATRGADADSEREERPVRGDERDSPSALADEPDEPAADAGPVSERPEATGSRAADRRGGEMIVQLFVFAKGEVFSGPAIEAATQRQHLIPGEMAIYHRRSLDGASPTARFSMANIVKPGTFPFDAMGGFSTPGLALFAQFDGRPSDLMVYDELVQTARALADELGGEVATKDRRPFDDGVWERWRLRLLRLIDSRADELASAAGPLSVENTDTDVEQSAAESRDDAASATDDPVPPDRR